MTGTAVDGSMPAGDGETSGFTRHIDIDGLLSTQYVDRANGQGSVVTGKTEFGTAAGLIQLTHDVFRIE